MTTIIIFSSWGSIFMNSVIVNSILDRVLHHVHVVQITGKAYRSVTISKRRKCA